jgi:c-di-GMP-binding flagellar brake protein YcgR
MGQKEPCFEEKRKYVRLQTTVEVEYTVIGKPGTIDVFSKNISAGGLCIVVEHSMANNTPVQLRIAIPDVKDPINALGRVVWQKKFEVAGGKLEKCFDTGVEFTGISDFDRFNINRYVMERIELEPS